MKRNTLIAILAISMLFAACIGNSDPNLKRGSSGKTLELLVVADKPVYSGSVKDSILAILHQPQFGLNQPEQSYDVVNIPISSFNNAPMFQAHRNVILITVNDTNRNVVRMAHDQWAQPQILFELSLSHRDSVAPFLRRYLPIISKEVKNCEHARVKRVFRGIENYDLIQKLRDNFGFDLTLSNEYYLCNMTADFAWLRKEAKDFSVGFIIRTMPYTKTADFDQPVILDQLDSTMKRIPGPVDSSYMATDRRLEARTQRVEFNSSYCVETRGIWHVEGNYFLSGPYVNYTLLTPDGENIVMLTGYVQAPGKNKRDHLMLAESICYSIDFNEKKK